MMFPTKPAKPLTMPEGLPEGPLTVEDWRDTEFNAFRVEAADSTVIAIVQDEVCARAIASLPDLYAQLAKAIAMADELWVAREQMRDELDAVRDKWVEECAQVVQEDFDRPDIAEAIRTLATGETKPSEDSKP